MSDYTVVSSEGFVRTLWGDDILLGLVSVLDSFFSFVGIFICRTLTTSLPPYNLMVPHGFLCCLVGQVEFL